LLKIYFIFNDRKLSKRKMNWHPRMSSKVSLIFLPSRMNVRLHTSTLSM